MNVFIHISPTVMLGVLLKNWDFDTQINRFQNIKSIFIDGAIYLHISFLCILPQEYVYNITSSKNIRTNLMHQKTECDQTNLTSMNNDFENVLYLAAVPFY